MIPSVRFISIGEISFIAFYDHCGGGEQSMRHVLVLINGIYGVWILVRLRETLHALSSKRDARCSRRMQIADPAAD